MSTIDRKTILILWCLALLVCGCSGDDPANPEPGPSASPSVHLSLADSLVDVGATGVLSISLNDIRDSVFALSLRVSYDPVFVGVDEHAAFLSGDFFGANTVALFQIEPGVMYLSITDIADNSKALKSGLVGTVALQGLSAGQCDFMVSVDDLRFIDATGADMVVKDLEISDVSLTVQ